MQIFITVLASVCGELEKRARTTVGNTPNLIYAPVSEHGMECKGPAEPLGLDSNDLHVYRIKATLVSGTVSSRLRMVGKHAEAIFGAYIHA